MEHRIGNMSKGLIRAIEQKNWYEIERLVRLGGDLNAPCDPFRNTPFLYAMSVFKKAEEIEQLIKLGGDLAYQNRRGETAMMLAIDNGCEAITPWVMVDYGADINVQDAWGNTALMRALLGKNIKQKKKLIFALIDYEADLTNLKNKEQKRAFDLLWDKLK